ncbi:DUF885 domain-containing protein [Paraferrimonas sedimenticola]|uniref:DUF885 domain-containing protein n=1 Tax=Paraferrimonas sedimenticola TaxID=375674 RepID=A0AA37RYC1_9GAMM|nr:DUF885 domain-containing protein [Paraferrimonas sedimenticola]GLP96922.1 hypothetical protein GCM10007895_22280 [Paraferrimonas sedimenticola]
MKRTMLSGSVLAACLAMSACSDTSTTAPKAGVEPTQSTANSAVSVRAEQAYLALADQYFNESLAQSPISATFVGLDEYNHLFGDELSDAWLKARHELNKGYLEQVKKIDRAQLSADMQLSYDMFIYNRELDLVSETFPSRFIPLNQFYSRIFTMAQLGSGGSAQPFNTVKDYRNWLERMDGFTAYLDRAIARMKEGMASKVVLPRTLVERMIPQIDAQLVEDPKESLFYSPIGQFPDSFSEAEKAELDKEYQTFIQEVLMPALSELREFLATDYLAASRGSDGMWGLPNGKLWYQHLANRNTTTQMPVDEIHELGLSEVARILKEMDEVRRKVKFEGDLNAFFEHLSSDPQFFFETPEQLVQGYTDLKDDINAVVANYFEVMPKADYEVRAVEAYREKSAAGASYNAPAVDGSRPGIFYINTYNLKAQPKWGMTTLSLHEAAPGHHFQIAIKQELTGVPQFQKFGGYTAFEEGWGLYAEYLGIEMGLFTDPYQYFGKLSDEMLRAMRLVVDTGLHAKGWSREQAIQYMLDNSAMAESDVTAEVERYMAIPGQALSYKVGQLKILELRARAEQALGDKFDLKKFHSQVLLTGSMPMAVLENKIDAWIASQK